MSPLKYMFKKKKCHSKERKNQKATKAQNTKFKIESIFSNPKSYSTHTSSNILSSNSIFFHYVPKSTILNSSFLLSNLGAYIPTFKLSPPNPQKFPPFDHPSRCVPRMIFPPPSSTHSQVFQTIRIFLNLLYHVRIYLRKKWNVKL